MMVDGEAARALARIARDRWARAGGMEIPPARRERPVWPSFVTPAFRTVEVGIARTDPLYGGRAEVREVEGLYLASIAAARSRLHMATQYFPSTANGRAIEQTLTPPRGPAHI